MHVFIRQQTHFILHKRINEQTCLQIPSNVYEVFLQKDQSKLFASYVTGIFQKNCLCLYSFLSDFCQEIFQNNALHLNNKIQVSPRVLV